jgi:hypothetical protein
MTVQYSVDGVTWVDEGKILSRTKEVLRFRNYVRYSETLGRNVPDIATYEWSNAGNGFIRWLGDWQEVEA